MAGENQDQEQYDRFRYKIYSKTTEFIFADKSILIHNDILRQVVESIKFYNKNGYYMGRCIECNKHDALVSGYCKLCYDLKDVQKLGE